jgi:alpha-L-rhamnosidase
MRTRHRLALVALIPFLTVTGGAFDLRAQAPTTVAALRTEYKQNPLGIDARQPRLAWQLRSERRAVRQTAYQVRVAEALADLRAGRRLTWDSGRVESGESVHRVYAGPLLRSGQRYFWQARVWDDTGVVGDGPAVAGRLAGELDRTGRS